MSDIELKLKEENDNVKKVLNFNGDEMQIKELFTNYIMNSKNGPNYFIKFLDFYSKCRPNQHSVSKHF